MDEVIFRTKLDRLRAGEMSLPPQEQNEIGKHARKHLPDLIEYTAAVEAGYRELTERLAAYRGQAKGRTLGQVVRNQWSDGACLGYAVMGLRQASFGPKDTVCVLEAMRYAMELYGLDKAAEAHQKFLEKQGWTRQQNGENRPPFGWGIGLGDVNGRQSPQKAGEGAVP